MLGGGRFDGTPADPYPYLYAAPNKETALLEALVRGIPFDDHGHRLMRWVAIEGRRISALRVTRKLTMVSLLTTTDLAAACQDEWLVQGGADPVPVDPPLGSLATLPGGLGAGHRLAIAQESRPPGTGAVR